MARNGTRTRFTSALRVLATAALLAPAGCGFHPMYGDRGTDTSPVATDLSAISVDRIPDRAGQLLRNQLVRLLNPDSAPADRRYTLAVELKEILDTFAVERSGFATRANIELTATYRLIDDATGNPVFAATSRAVSGFNLIDNDFSTVTSTGNARERVVDQIAYEMRNRLAGYFSRSPSLPPLPPSPPPPPAPDES